MSISTPLLQTKLHIPLTRPGLVARSRLTGRLAEGLTRPLTLISAPAGFGKTTLIAEWIDHVSSTNDGLPEANRERPLVQIAWLALDEGDNDPVRFWVYFIAALQSVQREFGAHTLALLQSAQPPPATSILILLLNELAALLNPLVLVLDDYHAIQSQPIHDALQFLLDHQPGNFHLILLTRSDPPLPLARWRARDQVLELHSADLRFTPEEAAAFLKQTMGLALTVDQVAQLETHTEGWIVGLQLAALSMKGRRDVASFIQNFAGSNRLVLDYLVDEVLQQQPADRQAFLLQTSILERLSPSLCDTLTERQDSHTILQQLERDNLFVVALDDERTWWRYHHLFADVLRSRLHRLQPALVPRLHRCAVDWFMQQHSLPEAIHHALRAADYGLAARLLERSADGLLKRGEHITLQGWLAQLPLTVLDAHPQLLLVHTAVLVLQHQLDRAERNLDAAELSAQSAEPALRQRILGETAAIRANIAAQQDDLPGAIRFAQHALAILPSEEVRLRGEVMFRLGVAYAWQGRLAEATQAYSEARRLGIAADDLHMAVLAVVNLATIQSGQGRLQQALATLRETVAWATQAGVQQMPILALAHVELGRLFYEFNDLELAVVHIEQVIQSSERNGLPRIAVDGHHLMVMLRQAQGDLEGAQAALRKVEQLVEQYQLPRRYRVSALQIKMRLSLASGDLAAAAAWAQHRGLSLSDELDYAHEDERLVLVYLLVAQGHYAEAVASLTRLHQYAEAGGRFDQVIQMLAFKAKALSLMGDQPQALATLADVLALGAPEGYVRAFIDQGEAMRLLILDFRVWIAEHTLTREQEVLRVYVDKLLAAFPDGQADREKQSIQNPKSAIQNLIEPLSERELAVLRLLAVGASNQEIGEQLIISLNTVKSHVRNIYDKLSVNNRMQAVAQARELGLL